MQINVKKKPTKYYYDYTCFTYVTLYHFFLFSYVNNPSDRGVRLWCFRRHDPLSIPVQIIVWIIVMVFFLFWYLIASLTCPMIHVSFKNILVFFFLRERQWHREGDSSLGIEQHDLGQPFDLMAANIGGKIFRRCLQYVNCHLHGRPKLLHFSRFSSRIGHSSSIHVCLSECSHCAISS